MAVEIPSDHESVMIGYQQVVQGMFQAFFKSTLVDDLDIAAARFANGLATLKKARDKALSIVDQASGIPPRK